MSVHHFIKPMGFFNPKIFGIEIIYTIIVVFLCLLIYYKTKEIYNLTRYKGIKYFRNAFLLFGLSYAIRFLLHFLMLSIIAFDFIIPRRMFGPLVMIPTGYLSTMAIFYLAYTTIWKKIKYEDFLIFSNFLAILVSLVAFFSRSHILLTTLQLVLLVLTILISYRKPKKVKRKTHAKALYILISIFWLLNLLLIGPRRLLPPEMKIILQLISVSVFIVVYYKLKKWIK